MQYRKVVTFMTGKELIIQSREGQSTGQIPSYQSNLSLPLALVIMSTSFSFVRVREGDGLTQHIHLDSRQLV